MAYGARPVPQNIMSVEFKILDFMTLKQFGISIALIFFSFAFFYFFPFQPWNIVIPLFVLVIGGIVVFVPFNGEPFQEFLSSYMEAMISPQRRIWHKQGYIVKTAAEKAKFYRYGNDPIPTEENKFVNIPQTPVNPNPVQTQAAVQLDEAEKKFLSNQVQASTNQPNSVTNQNVQGTNISPKTLQNNININKFVNKPIMNNQPPVTNQAQTNTTPQPAPQIPVQQQNIQATPVQNHNNQQQHPFNQAIKQDHATIPPIVPNQTPAQINQLPTFIKKEDTVPHNTPQDQRKMMEDEEVAVKNFIFGSIEDSKDEPVKQASVTIKDKIANTLEVIQTNSAGEFKTSYEYKGDEYIISVFADGKDFNEVKIVHEPVDPVPVTIHPRNYNPNQRFTEDESLPDNSVNDGVFEGAYDANYFNMGQDYLEEQVKQNQPVETFQIQEPIQTNTDINQSTQIQTEDSLQAKGNNVVHSAYSSQATNMFDQMMGGRIVNDYKEPEPVNTLTEPSQEILPTPNINQPVEPVSSIPPQPSLEETVMGINQTSTPVKPAPKNQAIDYDIEIAEFTEMANANVPFENNLINIPNTVNGILVAPNGYGLDGAQVRILDKSGILITSMNSDQTGRFYSYSPLPDGEYMMYISKNNQNLVGFQLTLSGKIIPPKYISFSY